MAERLPTEIKIHIITLASHVSAQALTSLAQVSRSFYTVFKTEFEHPSLRLLFNALAVDCGNLTRLARITGLLPDDFSMSKAKDLIEESYKRYSIMCHGNGTLDFEIYPEKVKGEQFDPAKEEERQRNKRIMVEDIKRAIQIHRRAVRLAEILEARYCQVNCCEKDSRGWKYSPDCPNSRAWEEGSLEMNLVDAYCSTAMRQEHLAKPIDHKKMDWTVNVYLLWLATVTLRDLDPNGEYHIVAERSEEWEWLIEDVTEMREVFPFQPEVTADGQEENAEPPYSKFRIHTFTIYFTKWLAMEMLTTTRGKEILFPEGPIASWMSKLTKQERKVYEKAYAKAVESAMKNAIHTLIEKQHSQLLYSALTKGTWAGQLIEKYLLEELSRDVQSGGYDEAILKTVFKNGRLVGFWGHCGDHEADNSSMNASQTLKSELKKAKIENRYCADPSEDPYIGPLVYIRP